METQTKSNLARKVLKSSAVGGAVIATAWLISDPLVDWYVGDYKGEKPQLNAVEPKNMPTKPEPVPAKRKPIEVAIGFDISKSDIGKELPSVVSETRKFLDDTGALQDGDKVSICTFVENAECREFQLASQKTALISYVDGIKLDPRKPNKMQTYVHASVKQILDQTGADMVFAWTDGKDQDQDSRQKLGADHSPVVIVVPDDGYVTNANRVKQTLGGSGVDVKVAATSEEFGKDLENFTGELNAEAQRKARQDAEKLYKEKVAQYDEEMQQYQNKLQKFEQDKSAYEKALKDLEQRKAALQAEIQGTKNAIKRVIAIAGLVAVTALISALSLLIGINKHQKNKPKFPSVWYIVDKRGRFSDPYRGPAFSDKPFNLNTIIEESIVLVPTKEGVVINGGPNNGKVILLDGDEIIPGVSFTTRDPQE